MRLRASLPFWVVFAIGFTLCWAAWLCRAKLAPGGSLECESIRGADQRHFCRAVTGHDPSECELISDRELRIQCRALAHK